MTGIIYKHTNKINGKSYIGQTIYSLESRLKGHLKDSKNNPKYPFQQAIAKYGIENFNSEILSELPIYSDIKTKMTTLDKAEIELINFHKTLISENGYNVSIGGNSPMMGRKHSEKSKILMRKNNKSQQNWDNYSETQYNNVCKSISKGKIEYFSKQENYDKHIERMRNNGLLDMVGDKNPFYGKSHSEDKKAELVNNRKDKNNGEYHPNGNRTAKKFKYVSPKGEEYVVFNSSKKFCEEHNISVKIFQKYPNQIISSGKSKGWKREEIS